MQTCHDNSKFVSWEPHPDRCIFEDLTYLILTLK